MDEKDWIITMKMKAVLAILAVVAIGVSIGYLGSRTEVQPISIVSSESTVAPAIAEVTQAKSTETKSTNNAEAVSLKVAFAAKFEDYDEAAK